MLNQEFAVVKRVRTAVFPVAGLGTRFLPATKAMPKEMLTVVDRPLIQYVVDEAREAGIDHFVFITGRNKGVIEDHFDRQFELETTLEARGKTAALGELRKDLPSAGRTSFTRQQEPLGLGHAVWCAREIVGREPFALLLPDMLFKAGHGVLKQMMQTYEQTGGNVIAVEPVPPAEVSSYGVVARGEGPDNAFAITGMVEKPKREAAPSNLIISGRYILQPEIFDLLADQPRGAGGEIQLTDAMQTLMTQQPFIGVQYEGQSFDCGSKIGFLTANVAYALDRDDIADDFLAALAKLELDAALSEGFRNAAE
jgi:UTP--glucose-1-phosphate uridylyltransferase